ncbi:hypothetical protein GCM10010909_00530 [Acidocella aquatica]|uniref:DUF2933 domain-containing protein n=1 Tax=Acidocella aquatica TaxID=1922313 RepID=A0ABQ6A5K7_9PROT|nr:hypothetical protein [Acidocella aquatica]GLR65375.1 hypothetical protein GCM10010909_00530 [Acidocella aquatica]
MGRTGIILGLIVIGGGALAFGGGWGRLVAIGVAPIILSILPCLVMCGLGLCMMGMRKGKKSAITPTLPLIQNEPGNPGPEILQGDLLEPSTPRTSQSFSNT